MAFPDKFCKDCRFYSYSDLSYSPMCKLPTDEISPINGHQIWDWKSCQQRREGECGYIGHLWEPSRWYRIKQWVRDRVITRGSV